MDSAAEPRTKNSPWPRRVLYASLAIAVGVAALAWFLLHHEPAPTVLRLSGDAQEMGHAYGDALNHRVGLLQEAYLKRGLCGGDEARFAQRTALADTHVDSLLPLYQRELEAAAMATGRSRAEFAYGNWLLDMGNASLGCRTVVCKGTQGLLHSHNLDWDNLAGFAKWTVTVLHRDPSDGRLRTVSIA